MGDVYTPQAIWGRELRILRLAAGLTQSELAEKIHFNVSLISQIETGQCPASPEFAAACDKVLKTGGLLLRLLDWRKASQHPGWFVEWRELESTSSTLLMYEPMPVPGLLQTEAYARVALRGDENAVHGRLERQDILTRADPLPPITRCVIDESILYRPIGGPTVMREQLKHLIKMTSPRLSVQIVRNGMHSDLLGGFAIARLGDGSEVAYLDTAVRGLTTRTQTDVTAALERFESIRTEALPVDMSINLIQQVVEKRWTQAPSAGADQATPETTAATA